MSTPESTRFNIPFFSQKPPPLPPKDAVYLQRNANRSFVSIASPEIHPPTPITPGAQYATLRPAPPPPPMLDPSLNVSSSSVSPSTRPNTKSGKFPFLRFSKRSPKTPTTPDDEPPKEDDNISMPWGFSHNIHVDEGLMGLPPSWSTTLPQLGFTEEEIAAIQAKRAAGARSPHDLTYLYHDRPNSPAALIPIPVLANPNPRSTSLAQQSPSQQPPTTPTWRVMPPKRKPPSPPQSTSSHRNQPSQSTLRSFSTDSHAQNSSTAATSSSTTAFQWPHSQSTSNLSTHSTTDENSALALAPLRLGSETTEPAPTQLATRFAVANPSSDDGHESREAVSTKHGIWGTKRAPARKNSTKDYSSRGETNPDLISHFSISPPPSQTSWVTTSLATAGSSLAAGVHKFKGAAEKGLGKVRGKGGSLSSRDQQHRRQRSQETQDTHGHDTSVTTDDNHLTDVVSIGHDHDLSSDPLAKPAIWQMYSRPRAGTDASLSNPALSRKNSTGSPAILRSASQGQLRAQYAAAGWTVPAINPDLVTAPSSSTTPPRPGRTRPRSNSHGSLQSKGSKPPMAAVINHNHSASSVSLESIPETSPALLPPVIPQLTASKSQPHLPSHSHKPSISSSSSHNHSNTAPTLDLSLPPSDFVASAVPPSMRRQRAAGNKPPRLSLHQSKGSNDLALWSASLLNNITLGGDKELDLGFNLDFDAGLGGGGSKTSESEGEGPSRGVETAKPFIGTSSGMGHTHKPSSSLSISASSSSSNLASSSGGSSKLANGVARKRSKERLPPAKPAPPSDLPPPPVPLPAASKPHPYAAAGVLGASSSSTLSGRSRSNSRSGAGTDREDAPNGRPTNVERPQLPAIPPSRPAPAPALFSPPPLPLPPALNNNVLSKSQVKDGPTIPPPPSSTTTVVKPAPSVLPLSTTTKPTPIIPPATLPHPPPPPPSSLLPTTAVPPTTSVPDTSFLSPPPTAWTTRGGVVTVDSNGVIISPGALSSNGPDSAQLWNEIELMMDPSLSMGMGMGMAPLKTPAGGVISRPAEGSGEPKTVGELVGSSPTRELPVGSSMAAGGPTAATSVATAAGKTTGTGARKSNRRKLRPEDEVSYYHDSDDEDEDGYSDYGTDDDIEDEDQSVRIGRVQQTLTSSKATTRTQAFRNAGSSSRSRERGAPAAAAAGGPIGRLHDELEVERGRDPNRDSSRSSTSTLTATGTTMIVGSVSIARRTGAYVIDNREPSVPAVVGGGVSGTRRPNDQRQPPSPLSSTFDSEESGGSGTTNSSTSQPTPTDPNSPSPLNYYLNGVPTASPREPVFKPPPPPLPRPVPPKDTVPTISASKAASAGPGGRPPGTPTTEGDMTIYDGNPYGGYLDDDDDDHESGEDIEDPERAGPTARPTIVINNAPFSATTSDVPSTALTGISTPNTIPQSPLQRYRGWVSEVVAPLEEFIDSLVDPREHYLDLKEIGESGSGSVYQALLNPHNAHKLSLSGPVKDDDALDVASGRLKLVAIKSVAIVPSGSPKLADIRHELTLMKGLTHDHVLGMDAVYVDLVDDALWIRMELMERSLADVIGLVGHGLMLQDRMIARFASDILHALEFLQKHGIAHRDVRSDNLLINKHGLLKLADFSIACRVPRDNPIRTEPAGVLYWQAPEILRGPYNALKVDVWSLGATVWEMAQTEPPFYDTGKAADRWPSLSEPQFYSPAFHDFLRKCSEPAARRPDPQELLKSSFINNACGRPVIVQALSQCMAIEETLQGE